MADYKQGYIRLESGNWIAIREAIGGRDACAHKARRLLDDGVPMWATAIPARTHVRLHGQSDANKRATDARRVQVATMEILVPGSRHSHLHVAFPRRRKSFIVAELAPLTNTTNQSIQGCALLFRTATLSLVLLHRASRARETDVSWRHQRRFGRVVQSKSQLSS